MEETTPSGREMDILKVLWEIGPASVREVCRRMCPNQELAFNTVQTLLRIMDRKGLVSHKRRGPDLHLYAALQPPAGRVALLATRVRRRDRPGCAEHDQHRPIPIRKN